jgi:myosin heavy subunit
MRHVKTFKKTDTRITIELCSGEKQSYPICTVLDFQNYSRVIVPFALPDFDTIPTIGFLTHLGKNVNDFEIDAFFRFERHCVAALATSVNRNFIIEQAIGGLKSWIANEKTDDEAKFSVASILSDAVIGNLFDKERVERHQCSMEAIRRMISALRQHEYKKGDSIDRMATILLQTHPDKLEADRKKMAELEERLATAEKENEQLRNEAKRQKAANDQATELYKDKIKNLQAKEDVVIKTLNQTRTEYEKIKEELCASEEEVIELGAALSHQSKEAQSEIDELKRQIKEHTCPKVSSTEDKKKIGAYKELTESLAAYLKTEQQEIDRLTGELKLEKERENIQQEQIDTLKQELAAKAPVEKIDSEDFDFELALIEDIEHHFAQRTDINADNEEFVNRQMERLYNDEQMRVGHTNRQYKSLIAAYRAHLSHLSPFEQNVIDNHAVIPWHRLMRWDKDEPLFNLELRGNCSGFGPSTALNFSSTDPYYNMFRQWVVLP